MVTKKNVIGLAKSGTATAKKPAAKKPAARKTRKPAAKKLTPAQQRDEKAKAKVEELLKDVDLTPEKKDDLLVLDDTPVEGKGVEWLEEQVKLLSEANGDLRKELAQSKEDYQKILNNKGGSNDGDLKKVVIQLFNELQENYIKMGINNQGIGNFRIYTPGFLNRLIKFFPFLEEVKRY